MQLRQIARLDDWYRFDDAGPLFITGLQALVRLLLAQSHRDRLAGRNTAGFVSGYRGSPLGGFDRELWRAGQYLDAAQIRFQPGLNEDLAATSIWGAQQANLFEGARYDGVFGMWYGKGPGVDRSGDPFKHGNAAGTSRYGGVIAVAGDDHTCKSSSLPHQSEYAFIDASMPVLNPANVEEIVALGLYGYAMSRFSGCWVGLKVTQETADATQSFALLPQALTIVTPEFALPPGGLNIRWPDPPNDQEFRLQRYKLPAALAFARANALDRTIIDSRYPRLGLVTTGKAHLDVLQALEDLGIDRARAADVGIKLFKVGLSWPLEPEAIRRFAEGLEEIIVVEEKRGVVESQIKEQLYNWNAQRRPLIIGKQDERGEWLLPPNGELTPALIARVLAKRMRRFHSSTDIEERVRFLEQQDRRLAAVGNEVQRQPHFCSGCPHNTSTRVPEGSRAVGGIGCHYMAAWMDRETVTFTQMGGEGATWIGQAPFTATSHVFQNLGDGTYAHSGALAIRAAVAAGVNMTYKILFNDAVAMTGGQPVEGHLTVAAVAQQLVGEGVRPIIVVTDEPAKYRGANGLPPSVTVHHRGELERLQRELRDVTGVSALIYDQTCAAELHRKRKRGLVPTPDRRVVINELVCEGCGDCSVQSNCLSVMSLETEFGRKRRINQSSCNQDFSCLNGFCPSFVTLKGAKRNAPRPLATAALPSLPEPQQAPLDGVHNVLIAGVGGTGVVTASGLLGLAAHLEGKAVVQLDQTGLAQKYGAVLSHVRIAADPARLHGMRIPAGQVDVLLGADLIVAAGKEPLSMLSADRSAVIVNTHEEMPSDFIRDRDFVFPGKALLGCPAHGGTRGRARDTRRDAARVGSARRQYRRERADARFRVSTRLVAGIRRGAVPSAGALWPQRRREQARVRLGTVRCGESRAGRAAGNGEGRRSPGRDLVARSHRAARGVSDGLSEPRLRRTLSRASESRRGRRAARSAGQSGSAGSRGAQLLRRARLQGRIRGRAAARRERLRRERQAQLRHRRAHELSFLAAAHCEARSRHGAAEKIRARTLGAAVVAGAREATLAARQQARSVRLERRPAARARAARALRVTARTHRRRARRLALRASARARAVAGAGARVWPDQARGGAARAHGGAERSGSNGARRLHARKGPEPALLDAVTAPRPATRWR